MPIGGPIHLLVHLMFPELCSIFRAEIDLQVKSDPKGFKLGATVKI